MWRMGEGREGQTRAPTFLYTQRLKKTCVSLRRLSLSLGAQYPQPAGARLQRQRGKLANQSESYTVKMITLTFAAISCLTGLVAAWYWLRASKIGISPGWTVEPGGETDGNIMGWVTGCMIAFNLSGKLNKLAARWTAAAVAFGAISNFLMAFV